MRISVKYLLILVISTLFTVSCSKEEEYDPTLSFARIYNDELFESSYLPMDFVQSSDKGFFVLSATDSWNTYIMKTDENGDFSWDYKLEENFVNPIQGVYHVNGAYYFFCMNDLSLATYLMKVDDNTRTPEIVNTYSDIIYPLHSSATGDGYLIVSYDRNSVSTKLTKLDQNFNVSWDKEYEVLEDVEEPLIKHLKRTGRRLPFFSGAAGNNYFFNAYYNFSVSLVFVNASNGEQTGVINGYRDEWGISSAKYIGGSNFALSRYTFDKNFILPVLNVNTSDIGFSSELEGNDHPEMAINASVYSKVLDVNGKQVTLFATSTKGGQILLYAYDALNGKLLGTFHLGRLNPYEAVAFVSTEDEGLAVLGTTSASSRFSRICLFKLSKQQLIELTSDNQ